MTDSHGWIISDDSNSDDGCSVLPAAESITRKRGREGKLNNLRFKTPSDIHEHKISASSKKFCPYDQNCYRSNPQHFQEYTHSKQVDDDETPPKKKKIVEESRNPREVWQKSSPHNLLLTTVAGIPEKFNYYNASVPLCSLDIKDILGEPFGDLLETAQFNYCIDVNWFLYQLPQKKRNIPVLFVHGNQGVDNAELHDAAKKYPNIKSCSVDLPPYGTHHTKMMFLRYLNGIRIVIHTANLRKGDWFQKSQGMWLSPLFPIIMKNDEEPKTAFSFKCDLLDYLAHYNKHPELVRWIKLIKSHDLSQAKVILIGSVPGRHKAASLYQWGHLKLSKALGRFANGVGCSDWPVTGQFSSIGSLGTDRDKWLCSEWVRSLSATKSEKPIGQSLAYQSKAPLKLIFPSVDDVRTSLEGYPAGACVPYSYAVAKKQPWLNSYMHRWKAGHLARTSASPHIKSYARTDSDFTKAAWFVLTSANLSKAAWGSFEKKQSQLMIRSFELGVLFLPCKIISAEDKVFHLRDTETHKANFTLPFSTPPTPYTKEDEVWVWNIPHTRLPDRHGNMWSPS